MKKYRWLHNKVIEDYQDMFEKYGFKINKSPVKILQICSYKTKHDYNKNYSDAIKELKDAFTYLIDIVEEIQKKIKDKTYSYLYK